jgi:hypothetical protein
MYNRSSGASVLSALTISEFSALTTDTQSTMTDSSSFE